MASTQGVASGADLDQSLRRRNVPSTSVNGGVVERVEADEKKKPVKKVCRWTPFQAVCWIWVLDWDLVLGMSCRLICFLSPRINNRFLSSWTSGNSSSHL